MASMWEVTAPSRLHFGLLSFGNHTEHQFGGAGVMLAEPNVCLRFQPSPRFRVDGERAARVLEFASHWSQSSGIPLDGMRTRIHVARVPRGHTGLGTGTQIALATAAGLDRVAGIVRASPGELALAVGRSKRSSVGSYGFHWGGLIAEAGHPPGSSGGIGELIARVQVPESWRVALVVPQVGSGLSGGLEAAAFAQLPPVNTKVTCGLRELLQATMIPALRAEDFATFCAGVYEYGFRSGECFAACQGGPYASPSLAAMVQNIRAAGFAGVGQSSWGPTLFVWLESDAQAADFARWFASHTDGYAWEHRISRAENRGARIVELAAET